MLQKFWRSKTATTVANIFLQISSSHLSNEFSRTRVIVRAQNFIFLHLPRNEFIVYCPNEWFVWIDRMTTTFLWLKRFTSDFCKTVKILSIFLEGAKKQRLRRSLHRNEADWDIWMMKGFVIFNIRFQQEFSTSLSTFWLTILSEPGFELMSWG